MIDSIEAIIAELAHRQSATERRIENMFRYGKTTDVDPKKHRARLHIGTGPDGTKQKSPWLPYGRIAGALKVHTPPSEGQNTMVICPGGNLEQGIIMPMTWNDENESPSEKGDEHVLTFGNVKVVIKKDEVHLTVGGVEWKLSADGEAQKGGGIGHDGVDVGKTHKHGDVEPGPGLTGLPVADGPTV